MSRAQDFSPKLSTLDIAKFQLMENGFAGVTNGVTMVPAKDARAIEAHHLLRELNNLVERGFLSDDGEATNFIITCKAFLEQYPENPQVATLVVFRPSIKEGLANVQPVARIIDPWEVIEPELAHTDGAGNVREDERAGNNPSKLNGSSGDETDNK